MGDQLIGSMKVEVIAAPVRQQVLETLRAAITAGRFTPGQRLIEKDLCELMGVSRPSVREALRQLESEGLIENQPNRGPVVTPLRYADLVDIYEVRKAMEATAARLFAKNASDEQIAAIETATDALADAYASRDVEAILETKARFYAILFEGSGNKMIPNIVRQMNARVTALRRLSLGSADRLPKSIEEIRSLVDALARRDGDAAAAAASVHIENAAHAANESFRAMEARSAA